MNELELVLINIIFVAVKSSC